MVMVPWHWYYGDSAATMMHRSLHHPLCTLSISSLALPPCSHLVQIRCAPSANGGKVAQSGHAIPIWLHTAPLHPCTSASLHPHTPAAPHACTPAPQPGRHLHTLKKIRFALQTAVRCEQDMPSSTIAKHRHVRASRVRASS